MLSNYQEGADVTLLNNFYKYPKKDPQTEKWDKGSMTLIYRDNETGIKHTENIENPDYEYNIATHPVEYNALFIPEAETRTVTCPFTQLEKSIAEETGYIDFYKDNMKNGNRSMNKLLHKEVKEVFASNMNIEDHYRMRFDRRFQNNPFTLSKAYFDIEADVRDAKGDFVEPGECPINAITIILEKKKIFYTLLLRNPENPQIEKFEKSIGPEFFQKVRNTVRNQVGGWKNEKRYKLDEFDYQFMFYDQEDEINLITDLFNLINFEQPDFVLAWNMAFDIPYIIARIKALGYKPEDIMCHPDFKEKCAEYFTDVLHQNEFEARGDFATISAYSVYMCQMIQFASRRKGQGAFPRFSLDFIGEIIAKVRKMDYSHICNNITELCWKDYEFFVIYNIIDTVVQYCIEQKTGDIDYTFGKSLMNNTRYSKTHRQTVYLVNRAAKEFWSNNEERFILSNNHNQGNDKPNKKFPGAFVANPLKLKPDIKLDIGGRKLPILYNLDDYDYKSLYPSIMREFNVAPNTQIGKLYIPEQIWKDENKYHLDHFDRGGKFNEDIQSHNWIPFCHRWLHMANYKELLSDINEYYTSHVSYKELKPFTPEGLVRGIVFGDVKPEYVGCIYEDNRMFKPIRFYRDYKEEINGVKEYYKERGIC